MKHTLCSVTGLFALLLTLSAAAQPKPSPYPISWELQFDYAHPKRIVVSTPAGQQAHWYMTYSITNHGRQEVNFLPAFFLLTDDGSVIRSDGFRYQKSDGEVKKVQELLPGNLLTLIRQREKNPHLEAVYEISRTIRLGEDQAKEGVAIFPEPDPAMGHFSILVEGLSGEMTDLTDAKGQPIMHDTKDGKKPIVLRKTLKIDYQMLGDGRTGNDAVEYVGQEWIMR